MSDWKIIKNSNMTTINYNGKSKIYLCYNFSRFKDMKNKKGFTLIELLGVMVIMGFLLLIVLPSLMKAGDNAKLRKFDEYYNLVKEASKLYATSVKSEELGDSKNEGCLRFSLGELEEQELIKPYSDKEYSVILVDGDTKEDSTELMNHKKGITVRNVQGKIDVYFSLLYSPKVGYKSTKKEVVRGLVDSEDICEPAPRKTNNDLSLKLLNGFNGAFAKKMASNFIYYSNNLWYAYKVEGDGTIKAVSTELTTMLPYMYESRKNQPNFKKSVIKDWINSVYSKTLSNPDKFLVISNFKTSLSGVEKSKFGLLGSDDIGPLNNLNLSFLNQYTWLEDVTSLKKARVWKNGSSTPVVVDDATKVYGVRPVVSFAPEVQVLGGTGSADEPFVLENKFLRRGSKVTRLKSGEYISIKPFSNMGKNKSYNFRVSNESSSKLGFSMILADDKVLDFGKEFPIDINLSEKKIKKAACKNAVLNVLKKPYVKEIKSYSNLENVSEKLIEETLDVIRGVKEIRSTSYIKDLALYIKNSDMKTIYDSCLVNFNNPSGKRRYQCDFDYQPFVEEENVLEDNNMCPDQKDKMHYSFDRSPLYRYLRNLYVFLNSDLRMESKIERDKIIRENIDVNSCMEIHGLYFNKKTNNSSHSFMNFVPKPSCSAVQSSSIGLDLNKKTRVSLPKVGGLFQTPYNITASSFFWTTTPHEAYEQNAYDSLIYGFNFDGSSRFVSFKEVGYFQPILGLANTLVITGGCGTKDNPYTVGTTAPTGSDQCFIRR